MAKVKIGNILNCVFNRGAISSVWSSSTAYTAGQYAVYQNYIYKCIKNASAGTVPTNTTYWEKTNLASEITSLNSNLVAKITYELPSTMEELYNLGTSSNVYMTTVSWERTDINPCGHNAFIFYGNWTFLLIDGEAGDIYRLLNKQWVKVK